MEKFVVLCFLETPVLRFALLAYYRGILNLERRFALGSCCHGNSQDIIVFRAATHCIAQILHIFFKSLLLPILFQFFSEKQNKNAKTILLEKYLENIFGSIWYLISEDLNQFSSIFHEAFRLFYMIVLKGVWKYFLRSRLSFWTTLQRDISSDCLLNRLTCIKSK